MKSFIEENISLHNHRSLRRYPIKYLEDETFDASAHLTLCLRNHLDNHILTVVS